MYNTRNSYSRSQNQAARYNNTGTFVPANQNQQSPQQQYQLQQQTWQQEQQAMPVESVIPTYTSTVVTPIVPQAAVVKEDGSMEQPAGEGEENGGRPKWRRQPGFKVKPRDRRRMQNKRLRRLLTPKNALMVLSEMTPNTQHQYTVAQDGPLNSMYRQYAAVLTVNGKDYRGTGNSKLSAKNNAAENVIRDLIITRMKQLPPVNAPDNADTDMDMSETDKSNAEEETFPMIQLASFALHKLFNEWQAEGYNVPPLKTSSKEAAAAAAASAGSDTTEAKAGKPKKPPVIPANAAQLHPSMVLAQMRPGLEYVLIACEGTSPSQVFTMGISVDGTMFTGKASNKKQARKLAAKAACEQLFEIQFTDIAQEVKME